MLRLGRACLLLGPCVVIGVQIHGAFSEDEILRAEELVSYVEREGDEEYLDQMRNFGTDKENEGGHQVTFLHEYAKSRFPELLGRIWEVAKAADSKAGWGTVKALGSQRLGLRCMESISYGGAIVGNSSLASSLGWHHDGHTLITVAVMLSRKEDYEGGSVEVRSKQALSGPEGVVSFSPNRGDAVAWQGWDYHRVAPVQKGLRHVLVAEFWSGPDVEAYENRPMDFEEGYRVATTLDPTAAYLQKQLAWMVFERGEMSLAFKAISAAIQSEPDVESLVMLGRIHQSRNELSTAKGAYDKAVELDPNDPLALVAVADYAREVGADIAEMEACYDKAAAAGGWQALEALGDIRSSQGRHQEAAENYRKSLDFDLDEVVQQKLQQSLERGEGVWSKVLKMLR